jgi:hypothetical protein
VTSSLRQFPRSRPQLTVVRGSQATLPRDRAEEWRRVARAVNACTREVSRHIAEGRWGRVSETVRERRELLDWMGRLPLDAHGHRCLESLAQAVGESDAAVATMMGMRRRHQ